MPFSIIRQDIVNMDVDALVSAGNARLSLDGGVSAAIFRAAGEEELASACKSLAPIKTAQAVVTPGFRLKAKLIIHTLGPVYSPLEPEKSKELLEACYKNVLFKALEYKCESLALPLISAGHFGYPKDEAVKIANSAVEDFLKDHDMDIYLTVYGREDFAISQKLMGQVRAYIDENYIERHFAPRNTFWTDEFVCHATEAPEFSAPSAKMPCTRPKGIEDMLKGLDESFSDSLLRLIDLKGKSDVEVYKKANMDRKLFSKIRSNPYYSPSKKTVLALAIALELSLSETEALLQKAGYSLTHSIKSDVIVEFFIVNENYNIFELNEVLFSYDQALL